MACKVFDVLRSLCSLLWFQCKLLLILMQSINYTERSGHTSARTHTYRERFCVREKSGSSFWCDLHFEIFSCRLFNLFLAQHTASSSTCVSTHTLYLCALSFTHSPIGSMSVVRINNCCVNPLMCANATTTITIPSAHTKKWRGVNEQIVWASRFAFEFLRWNNRESCSRDQQVHSFWFFLLQNVSRRSTWTCVQTWDVFFVSNEIYVDGALAMLLSFGQSCLAWFEFSIQQPSRTIKYIQCLRNEEGENSATNNQADWLSNFKCIFMIVHVHARTVRSLSLSL